MTHWSRIAATATAGLVGLVLDEVLGEPPNRVHPVALMGRALGRLEASTYRDDRSAGVLHLLLGVGATVFTAKAAGRLLGSYGAAAAGVGLASSGRMLREVAMTVSDQLDADDLDGARDTLRSLVGRDPTNLDEGEISRAVVESVAENTVDAVTATLFWAAAAGPTGVWVHRTVNTLDAMVGHRSPRYQNFGWASARLDDVMNWVPARLTAGAVAVAAPAEAKTVMRVVRRDGRNHPSPNGGMVEAAFAAALGVTLGGANDYGGVVELRGQLGDGPGPDRTDIARAVQLSRRVSWIVGVIAGVAQLTIVAFARSSRR